MSGDHDFVSDLDAWLIGRCQAINVAFSDHVNAGGDPGDLRHRMMLGEHHGYMRVRSWLSGHRRATTRIKGE